MLGKNKLLVMVAWLVLGILLIMGPVFLSALEIRLNPPEKFYVKGDHVYIDLVSTESLLSGDDLDNLYFDIPITVTYYIEFYEDRWAWDNLLADIALVKKVYYDQWSKEFFTERGENIKKYKNLTQLKNDMVYLDEVKLVNMNLVNANKEYYFKTRIAVKIKNFTLYYYLINNLISIFKYKTTYYYSPRYTGKEILGEANK